MVNGFNELMKLPIGTALKVVLDDISKQQQCECTYSTQNLINVAPKSLLLKNDAV